MVCSRLGHLNIRIVSKVFSIDESLVRDGNVEGEREREREKDNERYKEIARLPCRCCPTLCDCTKERRREH